MLFEVFPRLAAALLEAPAALIPAVRAARIVPTTSRNPRHFDTNEGGSDCLSLQLFCLDFPAFKKKKGYGTRQEARDAAQMALERMEEVQHSVRTAEHAALTARADAAQAHAEAVDAATAASAAHAAAARSTPNPRNPPVKIAIEGRRKVCVAHCGTIWEEDSANHSLQLLNTQYQ